MSDSLNERLAALDKAREQIIHDSFVEKQKQLDDDIRKSTEDLESHVSESESE